VLCSTGLRYCHFVWAPFLGFNRMGCDDLGTKQTYRWNNIGVNKHKMSVAPSYSTNHSLSRDGEVILSALTWHPSW